LHEEQVLSADLGFIVNRKSVGVPSKVWRMPSSGTSIFTDPNDYQDGFRGAKFNLVFTCCVNFRARLTWVELPNLHLLHCHETLQRTAYVSLAPQRVYVAFPTQFDPPVVWNGAELRSGDIVFHSQGECMHQRTSGASHWAFISLEPKFLARYGKALTGLDLTPPPVGRILRPPPAIAARLLRLHTKACRLAETKPKIVVHHQVARSIEQDLLRILVTCLTAGAVHDDTVPQPGHPNIMIQFEDMLASYFNRQLRTSEICASIGVSERTFRACCAEFLGLGPSRYLRLRRLNLVHAALLRADPAARIKEIASRYGFSELGAYRRVFGETPSNTLQHTIAKRFDISTEFA
jgi:AraC-like DNA-binding protein